MLETTLLGSVLSTAKEARLMWTNEVSIPPFSHTWTCWGCPFPASFLNSTTEYRTIGGRARRLIDDPSFRVSSMRVELAV